MAETRYVPGRNVPVMNRSGLRDSSVILFAKKQRKKTLKILKLCTKSCMSSDDQQSKRKFYCHKATLTTRTTTLNYLPLKFNRMPGCYLGFFVWGRSQFEWSNEWSKARSILGGSEFFGNGYVLSSLWPRPKFEIIWVCETPLIIVYSDVAIFPRFGGKRDVTHLIYVKIKPYHFL